ncbi:MAG: peptidoglycan recognition family protein [Armatimonadota bacterium]|nr:peptidoglycan recognition protein family protein [Fimbriimonadaceae bacterium]MCZ8138750.1 peptidoglycan recognition family protein [Fimbriimonadaceae bacterium]
MAMFLALVLMGENWKAPDVPTDGRKPAIWTREEWGAKPPVLPMEPHTITRITIHHTGVKQTAQRDFGDKLRGLQAWSQREDQLAGGRTKPQWTDIPYHYYIDWSGRIAEARPVELPGDTNTSYDVRGHLLIVVEGLFPEDTLHEPQRKTLYQLTSYLAREHKVFPHAIKGHVDFAPGETDCPGASLIHEIPHLRLWLAQQEPWW